MKSFRSKRGEQAPEEQARDQGLRLDPEVIKDLELPDDQAQWVAGGDPTGMNTYNLSD